MHRVVALYSRPKDPEHFKKYYEETHLPLVSQVPGLLSSRYSFSTQGVGAESPYFCVWEGEFANEAAMGAAMQSPAGQRVTADVANYATGGVTILHYDLKVPTHPTKADGQGASASSDTFSKGLQIRREMFGPALADQRVNSATDFNRFLEELVTRYCFGEVWTRPPLDRKTRSLLTLAVLVSLGKPVQLKGHVRGAIANGATKEEIRETLLHAMIYCGVPAGVDSFNHAAEVLKEMGLE